MIELVGKVNELGTSGPTNGMYHLQRALEKHYSDVVKIVNFPSFTEGTIPWIWSDNHRGVISTCIGNKFPYIMGPNVVFIDKNNPRQDLLEQKILDSSFCIASLHHTSIYSYLVDRSSGGDFNPRYITFPYPVAVDVEVCQAEYDLLIYHKSGDYHNLIDRLERSPSLKTCKIIYGHHTQHQLLDVASKSSCAIYLSSDDHGPIVFQELVSCGCPVISTSIGCPTLRHNVHGKIRNNLSYEYIASTVNDLKSWSRYDLSKKMKLEYSPSAVAGSLVRELTSTSLPEDDYRPTVSVIIPAYIPDERYYGYLQRALVSLSNQTFKDFEVVLVMNDCCKFARDNIKKFCDSLFYHVNILYKPDRDGTAKARQLAYENSCGKFIACLDADDEYLPDKLDAQYRYLLSNPHVDICFTSSYDRTNSSIHNSYYGKHEHLDHEWISKAIFEENVLCGASMFASREAIDRLGGFHGRPGREDWDMWQSSIKKGLVINKIPQQLYVYTQGTSLPRIQ